MHPALSTVRPRLGAGLRRTETGLVVLALGVGAGAGGGAIVFRWLIETFTRAFTGHADYAGAGRVPNPHVPALGVWFVVLAPVVAGLLYGPLVHAFAREARGHGVPEVMYAVARNKGRIKPQVAGVKALASALCIGGGGSVGREGPIVQIGSALGSTLGRLVAVDEQRTRVLVACGAAGGISATFNAPLAGVFFAMELVLREFTARSFGMVALSSVTAGVIGRAAFGDTAFLTLPGFHVTHPEQYGWFALLGVIAGLVGVAFTRVLYWIEDACDWAWRGPEWLRPAVGGVLLGGLLLAVPQMYGVGYPVLGRGVVGGYTVAALLGLLVAKVVATSLTIGIGGSGGVFAPSLFVGAMLGGAYGSVLHSAFPHSAGSVGAYGLIGMGAVFAGAARAPITAVVILVELTGEYSIVLPLMTAIVLATGVSHALSRDTVYTAKLRRRGVDLDEIPTAPEPAAAPRPNTTAAVIGS
ncbi:chloride channel protein [Jatrophihabitans fulvus]